MRVQAVASHAGGSTGFAQKLKETALLRQYERANERVFVQSRFNPRLAGASRHRRSPLATPDERGRADDPAWWADHAATGGGVYLARWYYRRVARFPARFAPAPHLAAARPGQTGHRPGARAPGEDRRNLQRPSGGVARWCDAGHDEGASGGRRRCSEKLPGVAGSLVTPRPALCAPCVVLPLSRRTPPDRVLLSARSEGDPQRRCAPMVCRRGAR